MTTPAEPDAPPADPSLAGASGSIFKGDYRPVRVPALYRFAAAAVLVMVVAQVIVYVGLVVLAAYGVYWWGEHGLFLVRVDEDTRIHGRTGILLWILRGAGYVAPLLAGTVLVLTMAAPFLPRRREHRPAVSLDPRTHRRTYAYVEQLCAVMKAPKPVRIDVSCDANASAHMEGGLLGVLIGRRLVLTIGLSLAAGMRRSELTGVIAHELGHFTQGGGMRSTWVIRKLNAWFEHAVFSRSAMDHTIDNVLEESWWPLQLIAFVCRIVLGVVRWVLLGFMYASHAVSCFLLRRMEFAADACEARVSGSRTTAWASARVIELSVGWERAIEHTRSFWMSQRKLPDDLPRLSVRTAPRAKRRRDGFLADYKDDTKWWHTHPGMNDRVAAVLKANEPGILRGDGPASSLIEGFDDMCRIVTAHLHMNALGEDYSEQRLVPVSRVLGVASPIGPQGVPNDQGLPDDADTPIPLA